MRQVEAIELVAEKFWNLATREECLKALAAANWQLVLYADTDGFKTQIVSTLGARLHPFGGCWEGDLTSEQWSGRASIPQQMYDDYHKAMEKVHIDRMRSIEAST